MIASLLFVVFALTFASEVADNTAIEVDQIGRVFVVGTLGDDAFQNKSCYLISARYNVTPANAVGDLLFAAMGYNIAGFKFPWTAIGYYRGSASVTVDIATDGTKSLSAISARAQAAVVAWAWLGLVEFCDMDSSEGFQRGGTDFIIANLSATFANFDETCGFTTREPYSGQPAYFANIQSRPFSPATNSNFNASCYAFRKPVTRFAKFISDLGFECDVYFDVSNLWSQDLIAVNSCPDSKRKFGVALIVAGATFDVNVQASNLNGAGGSSQNQITFNSGALAFAWDNYYRKPNSFQGTVGVVGVVKASYLESSTVQYAGAATAHVILFTFDGTKAQPTTPYYFWDPSVTVQATSTSTIASLFLIVLVLFGLF